MRCLALLSSLPALACSLHVDGGAGSGGGVMACDHGRCPAGLTCDEYQFCVPASAVAPDCTAAIAGGDEHSCAIRDDGTAWCWGRNDSGQLGDNTTQDRIAPVQVTAAGMPPLVAIASGPNHNCAIDREGGVWCWGDNGAGQLGNNTTADEQTPVKVVNLTGATAIVAGSVHTCAIASGAVSCWGSNSSSQLGSPGSSSPVPKAVIGLSGVTALSARSNTTCAVDGSGLVWCWGDNRAGQFGNGSVVGGTSPAMFTMSEPATAVSVAVGSRVSDGVAFTCALTSAGKVLCAGANDAGQLGNGVTSQLSSVPVAAQLPAVALAIVAGDRFACAVDDRARAWCWGDNSDGQYGNETFTGGVWPTRAGYDGAVQLAAGNRHLCVVSKTGAITCGGANKRGQLGDGRRTTRSAPGAVVELSGAVQQVVGGAGHSCALLGDGTVQCWGSNSNGQLGDGTKVSRPRPAAVEGLTKVSQLVSGSNHVCALSADHAVACWGRNHAGQLGGAAGADRAVASPVPGLTGEITQLSAASDHTCAIGSGVVQCWGSLSDVPGTPDAVKALTPGARALGVGGGHACVINADTTVTCWGNNKDGQLGDGTITDAAKPPVIVKGPTGNLTGIDQLAAGDNFTCAHASDDSVWCWGFNGDGELGDGLQRARATAAKIENLGAAVVAAGNRHACAVRGPEGTLACWGAGFDGQLGTERYGVALTPATVAGAMASVGLGAQHTCAVAADGGGVMCWGNGRSGQLGDGASATATPIAPLLMCPAP